MYKLVNPSLAGALTARGATGPRRSLRSTMPPRLGNLSSPPVRKFESTATLRSFRLAATPPALALTAMLAIDLELPLHILGVTQHFAAREVDEAAVTPERASIAMSTNCLPIPITHYCTVFNLSQQMGQKFFL
jgi:hypothetical protein